jgi:hypothetical protein
MYISFVVPTRKELGEPGAPDMTKSLPLGPDLLGGRSHTADLAPTDTTTRRHFIAVT